MAYSFGATSNIINCGTSFPWSSTGKRPFSVFCRVRPNAVESSYRSFVHGINSDASIETMFLRFMDSGNNNDIQFGFYDATSTERAASWVSGFTTATNYDVLGVYDGATVKIYAGGSVTARSTYTTSATVNYSTNVAFTIGNNIFVNTHYAKAAIWDVAYWASGVSAGDIATLMMGGGPLHCSVLPQNYWPLINDARDIIGGRPGTVSAATVVDNGPVIYLSSGARRFQPAAPATGPVSLTAVGLAVQTLFGTPSITRAGVSRTTTGLAVPVSFGTPTLQTPHAITGTALAVPVLFGTPTVNRAGVSRTTTGLAVPVSFGTPALQTPHAVTATGLAVPVAFGTPTLQTPRAVTATGLAVSVAFGTPTVQQTGAVSRTVTGLAVPVAFGTPELHVDQKVTATGLAVSVAFGTPSIVTGGGLRGSLARRRRRYWRWKEPEKTIEVELPPDPDELDLPEETYDREETLRLIARAQQLGAQMLTLNVALGIADLQERVEELEDEEEATVALLQGW